MYASPDTAFFRIITFIGTPYIALLIGALVSFLLPSKISGLVTDTDLQRDQEER